MKTMKTFAAVAGIAATSLALGGCAASDGEGEALEFQTGLSAESPIYLALEEATAQFEASDDGIAIDLIPSTGSYEADMRVRLGAGDPPDIFQTHGWSLLRYSEFLTPLQDEPWAADVNPALDAAMRGDDGELYAFPVDTDVAGIIVNEDLLAEVGVDGADIGTWDDFSAVAEDLAEAGFSPISVAGRESGPAGNLADWIAPGAYSEDELAELSDGEFVAEPYERMLEMIDGWREAGFINPDYSSAAQDDMARALADGTAAFVFSQNQRATQALGYAPDAAIGFIPVPGFDEGSQYLIGGEMNAFGVAADGTDVEGALRYLEYLAQDDVLATLAAAAGSIPGLTTVTTDLGALQSSYDEFVAPGELPLEPYFDRVYLPNGMWNTLVTTTDAVLTGQSTPAAATEQVAADFASLYGQE